MKRRLPILGAIFAAFYVLGREKGAKGPTTGTTPPGKPPTTGATNILGQPYIGPPDAVSYDFNYLTGTCNPNCSNASPPPGVGAFRSWALQRFPGGQDGGICRACHTGGHSEHKEGRAWDFSSADPAPLQALVDFLTANNGEQARRAGIFFLIYNHQKWRPDSGFTPYNGANGHTTHVHLSFSHAGAAGATSFYG